MPSDSSIVPRQCAAPNSAKSLSICEVVKPNICFSLVRPQLRLMASLMLMVIVSDSPPSSFPHDLKKGESFAAC